MNPVVFLIILLFQSEQLTAQPPESLQRIFNQRSALATGRVVFSRQRGTDAPQHFVGRLAEYDVALEYLGDDSGMLFGRPVVDSPDALDPWSHQTLYSNGNVWQHGTTGFLRAEVTEKPEGSGIWDIRGWGTSYYNTTTAHEEAMKNATRDPVIRYDARRDGQNEVVTSISEAQEIEWHLDAAHGGAPTRVVMREEGEVVAESRIALDDNNGIWYPRRIEYYRSSHNEGRTPYEVVEVHAAEFNQPGQPLRLTPNDIGVEVGTNVIWQFADGRSKMLMWDGNATLSQTDFSQKLRDGDVVYSPYVQRRLDENRAAQESPEFILRRSQKALEEIGDFASEWERYTTAYGTRHSFVEAQWEKAEELLDACQDRAKEYIAGRAAAIRGIEKDVAECGKLSEPQAGQRAGELRARVVRLLEPINEIFEEKLKPGLGIIKDRSGKQ